MRLVNNWNDMSYPMLRGDEIPPSSYDPRSANIRAAALKQFHASGLRWIALDLGAYNDDAIALLEEQINPYVQQKVSFEEGDGVLVYELK